MNIVILAAGQGRRMHSDLPKVLHRLAGRPLLGHVLETARALCRARDEEARILVVVGHGAELVREAFAAFTGLAFVVQSPQRGTGDAVRQAAPGLDPARPTLVLYGDVPLVRAHTLDRLLGLAQEGPALLTVRLADPSGYGRILRDTQGHVQAIVEERDATARERAIDEVHTGILASPTPPLLGWLAGLRDDNAQGEFYLTDIVGAARAQGVVVRALTAADPDEVLGVNSREQLARLERVAQRRIAGELLESGVSLADPARIDVRGSLHAAPEVTIDVGCVFEGEVHLARGVQVGPYCVLRDARIDEGARLEAYTHVEGAHVGAGARVGPFSRLRPGADLGEDVHVGNFVEVKAARLDRGAKANHLAYVGDAHVGERSNIGAGTIFANYDGANKHRSEVGADVHLGSNSVLVAPASVGEGATIGAGSTVQGQVPAHKLTVARARQVTIEGWKRPRKK